MILQKAKTQSAQTQWVFKFQSQWSPRKEVNHVLLL